MYTIRTVLLLAALTAATGNLMAQQPTITTESPLAWLQMTPSTDPNFTALVNSTIGADVANEISYALPYAVVVTNTGSTAIATIGLVFTVQGAPGTPPLLRQLSYQTYNTPQRPILAPGQSRVFTALSAANEIAAHAAVQRSYGNSGSGGPHSRKPTPSQMADLTNARSIHIAIDLAVSPSGLTAGKDTAQAIKVMRAQKAAYAGITNEFTSRVNNGDSAASIQAWLETIAAQPPNFPNGDQVIGQANIMRAARAKEWLVLLKSSGINGVMARAKSGAAEKMFPGIESLKEGLQ